MKTYLEAYKNSYLQFIDPWVAVAVYTDTLLLPRLRMRTEA